MPLRPVWLVVLSAILTSVSAFAVSPTREDFDRLAPQLRGAAAKKLAVQPKRVTARNAALDTTAPRITALSVSSGYDATRPPGGLKMDLVAVDDLSGLDQINITWQHQVNGRTQNAWLANGLGRTEYHENGRLLMSGVVLPPGPWKIVEAFGWDMAGNVFYYDRDQLAALGGNLSFEVRNNLYEEVAPALVRGKILVDRVSRSTPWPGTADVAPLLTVDLTAREPKTTRMSGVGYATLRLCTDDQAHCLDLSGSTLTRSGEVSLQVGGSVQPSDDPGIYHLHSLNVYDDLGNATTYFSTRFGGDADFSLYFPKTQVEITP